MAHVHAHAHPHGHSHAGGGRPAALGQAFLVTAGVLAIEVVAGLAAHSLALLSDAGHLVTDVAALGLAWFAVRQASRPADERRTYGYQRAGILAALFNGIVLVLVVFWIGYEAVHRLAQSQPVDGRVVVVAALVAIVSNAYIALRLRGQGEDLNVRAALLHVLGDLAASLAVVVAGGVILLTGWLPADPLVSLAVAVLISIGAVRLVFQTVHILLEGVPAGVDLAAVRAAMEQAPGVDGVHDLHVWSLSGTETALSAHVVAADGALSGEDSEHLVRALERRLCDDFGIGHSTIQVEVCHPCEGEPHATGQAVHNHPHSHTSSPPGG